DLHNNIRSKSLAWAINAPYASFNKLNLEKWLLVQFKINRLPSTHIVDRYLQSASKFNLEYDGKGLDFFFAPSFQTHPAPPTPFITLAIGGQHATKRMPLIKLG